MIGAIVANYIYFRKSFDFLKDTFRITRHTLVAHIADSFLILAKNSSAMIH